MAEEFRGLTSFYQELCENSISEKTVTALDKWLEQKSTNMESIALDTKLI